MKLAKLERILPWVAGALLLGANLWPRVFSGLAIDEAGSAWIVKESYAEAVRRAWSWSATSPFYYSVLWVWTRAFGAGELGMRALSILFSLLTLGLLYRLALRWLDEVEAKVAVLVFMAIPLAGVAFIDIRPYAMGLALVTASWLALQRWLERGRWFDGLLFVLCSAGAIWCHYTFVLGLVPLLWYLPRLGGKRAAIALAALALLLTPLAFQFLEVLGRRQELSYADNPSLQSVVRRAAGHGFRALLAAGALLAASASANRALYRLPRLKQSWIPLALLAFLPPAALWLFGHFARSPMYHDRYMAAGAVGIAILGGAVFRGFEQRGLRALALAAFTAAAVVSVSRGSPYHMGADWRGMGAWVEEQLARTPETKVAVASPFIESLQDRILNDPNYAEILHGPLARYLGVNRGLLLPGRPTAESGRRLEQILRSPRAPCAQVLFVTGTSVARYRSWLKERLEAAGYRLAEERAFGLGAAWVYTNCGGGPPSSSRPKAPPAVI